MCESKTVDEVAEAIGKKPWTVYRLLREGILVKADSQPVGTGRPVTRITAESVAMYIKSKSH